MHGDGLSDTISVIGSSGLQGVIVGLLSRLIVDLTTQIIKWFLLIEFLILKYLESRDIIIVDWGRLTFGLMEFNQRVSEHTISIFIAILETGAFGVGFLGGYFLSGKAGITKYLKDI